MAACRGAGRLLGLIVGQGWELLGQPVTEFAAHGPGIARGRGPFKGAPTNPPVKASTIITVLTEAPRIQSHEHEREEAQPQSDV